MDASRFGSPSAPGSDGRLPQLRGAPEKYAAGGFGDAQGSGRGRGQQAPRDADDDALSREPNPFTLPREDVFLMREREKASKAAERDKLARMKIWEKPAKSSALAGGAGGSGMLAATQQVISTSYADRKEERQKYLSTTLNTAGAMASRALHPGVGPAAMAASAGGAGPSAVGGGAADRLFASSGGRRREKENMSDFIAKKRDMFLIQMSLDTKRSEIQKLEEKAQMKEDALKKSEMMLEEDAMRFDAFLKENDRKAHDALKRADLETKEKQEKVLEIKKLNAEISKVENEMSKYEEQLLACMKYKEFLDSLTPQEHWDKIAKRKAEKAKARAARQGLQAGGSTTRRSATGSTLSVTGDEKENGSAADPTAAAAAAASSSSSGGAAASGPDDLDDDDLDSPNMYFEKPEQLLEIFAQLEERNLFLIQNVQETEEALDDLQNKFAETRTTMEAKTQKLHASIADLKAKIQVENEKADALKNRARSNALVGTQQKLLAGLSEKVSEVYAVCDFDGNTQTDTLDMLRDIEQWLETLLHAIAGMDPAKVEAAEKQKNAERRNQNRNEKKEEQKRLYEERLAKSTARAKAEVIKQTGKQVMFRSPPIRKKKKKENVVERDEEAEELKRFFT